MRTTEELKHDLDLMGVAYPATASDKTLAALLKKAMNSDVDEPSNKVKAGASSTMQRALKKRNVMVICNNPNKKDLRGDFVTSGNSVIGVIREFVPFNTDYQYVSEKCD